MNAKFLVILTIALLTASCNADSKEKGKGPHKNSKESSESIERKDSAESFEEKPKLRPGSTAAVTPEASTSPQESSPPVTNSIEETEDTTVDITAETTVEPDVETTEEPIAETSTVEQPTTVSISEAELKALCKGQLMGLKHYPGDCSRYVVCALGRLVGEYSCELSNINHILGICAC
ncbi:AAEL002612-PA [Aedes aegypti]|uniref:AAEL002612-PA n=1 Tax=Aedes aegypti TaxID=7159 RepID=Q17HS0_AEDAE|nr:AAEL002612-PA [Aedes aegypti]